MPAPPGRTLVALVDARGPSAGAPRVVLRGAPTPAVPLPFPDLVPPEGAAGVGYLVGGDHPVWTSALRADPVVGAFLEGHGAD